ncbi:Zinc finger, CCCH-type [Artemisia annua]|uniref:Zinc finger, CCCH-type n=1 Tax=Artemisia annua TaxID=35608 RepID=A0A2U1NBK3_ARTAN|nr:Zinc finger, CCCH-type [Artemisia annua]
MQNHIVNNPNASPLSKSNTSIVSFDQLKQDVDALIQSSTLFIVDIKIASTKRMLHDKKGDQYPQMDADVYSREPSPGFDVLVDNEIEDGEYQHEKEESFAKSRSQDYNVDRIGREHRDFENYTERDGQYIWDETRQEKRPYHRNNSPDQYNRSDLRQRISNQRRAYPSGSDHGTRFVASREYADRMPRRDNQCPDYRQDREAICSRLQGRIKLPGRSASPPNGHNPRTEREIDTERKHLSRFRDRISDNDTKFAGPKKLSELKTGGRIEHQPNEDQSLGKRKYARTEEDSSSSFKEAIKME